MYVHRIACAHCVHACTPGFYKYDGFDKYDLSEVLSAPAQEPMAKATNGEDDEKDKKVETAAEKAAREAAENERFLTMAFLLR